MARKGSSSRKRVWAEENIQAWPLGLGCEESLGARKQPIRVSPRVVGGLDTPRGGSGPVSMCGPCGSQFNTAFPTGTVSAGAGATAAVAHPRLEGGTERSVRPPMGERRRDCVHRWRGPVEGVGTTSDRTVLTRNPLGTCSRVMLPFAHPVRVDHTPQDPGLMRNCQEDG